MLKIKIVIFFFFGKGCIQYEELLTSGINYHRGSDAEF